MPSTLPPNSPLGNFRYARDVVRNCSTHNENNPTFLTSHNQICFKHNSVGFSIVENLPFLQYWRSVENLDFNTMRPHKPISHSISVACSKVERPIYLYEQHSSWCRVCRYVCKDEINNLKLYPSSLLASRHLHTRNIPYPSPPRSYY